MSNRTWSALGRLWDSLVPGMMCLNPMAMAYYLATIQEEMPLTESIQTAGMTVASETNRSGPVCLPASRTVEIGA